MTSITDLFVAFLFSLHRFIKVQSKSFQVLEGVLLNIAEVVDRVYGPKKSYTEAGENMTVLPHRW